MPISTAMNKNKNSLSDKDYVELGKAVQRIISHDYMDLALNRSRLLWTSFLKGIAVGLGGVLGATIVVALLLWILSLFGELPWIGDFFRSTRDTISH